MAIRLGNEPSAQHGRNAHPARIDADAQHGPAFRIVDLDGCCRALGRDNALLVDGDGYAIDVLPWDHQLGTVIENVSSVGWVN